LQIVKFVPWLIILIELKQTAGNLARLILVERSDNQPCPQNNMPAPLSLVMPIIQHAKKEKKKTT
jgi:hypothetical protein